MTKTDFAYESPRISEALDNVLLESVLLAGSIFLSRPVEIAGQVNDGFYDGDDLNQAGNYWEN